MLNLEIFKVIAQLLRLTNKETLLIKIIKKMKNSSLKGALGALAVVGGVMIAKKIADRKKFMKDIFDEYDIKERNPFGLADKIRELNDEEYSELKGKFKDQFASKCCTKAKQCCN